MAHLSYRNLSLLAGKVSLANDATQPVMANVKSTYVEAAFLHHASLSSGLPPPRSPPLYLPLCLVSVSFLSSLSSLNVYSNCFFTSLTDTQGALIPGHT